MSDSPHSARLWNYWLGGTDNYAVDRAAGDEIARRLPSIVALAREDRKFLRRMVRHLVEERGIRQILDIGAGLPTAENTHQVAPRAKVVYVDNDPLVLDVGTQLLDGAPNAAYVRGDLNDPAGVLKNVDLDFGAPIAVTLLGVVHFVRDDERAREIVKELVAAVPSGSYLAIAHACRDINTAEADDVVAYWNAHGTPKIKYRSAAEITRYFEGLEVLEPGIVPCNRWLPDREAGHADVNQFCGVARKP